MGNYASKSKEKSWSRLNIMGKDLQPQKFSTFRPVSPSQLRARQ